MSPMYISGALAHRVQTLQDADRIGVVLAAGDAVLAWGGLNIRHRVDSHRLRDRAIHAHKLRALAEVRKQHPVGPR